MAQRILADMTASIAELEHDPMGTVAAGDGLPVAILDLNQTAFYCVPAAAWEALLERLDDLELDHLADARLGDGKAPIPVALDDL